MAAPKESTAGAVLPEPSPSLLLAEKWAKSMGKEVQRRAITIKEKPTIAILVIMHGSFPLIVFEERASLSVNLRITLTEEDRAKIASLGQKEKLLAKVLLFQALVSSDRTAFMSDPNPKDLKDIAELKVIDVSQILRISESDPGTFNRFADAMQEIVTTAVRALQVLGVSVGKTGSSQAPPKSDPGHMFG